MKSNRHVVPAEPMGKRKATKVAKVSISMDAELYREAQERAAELGMDSFSKYVAHALREDVVRRGNFVITQRPPRNGGAK
jgi:hypothetical protein